MTTAELIRMSAADFNRKAIAEIVVHAESIAEHSRSIRETSNTEERIAFDAFQNLANAGRHILSLQTFGLD